MNKIFEELAKLPFFNKLLELTGIDENYFYLFSLIIVFSSGGSLVYFVRKKFKQLIEWHGIINKARDLKPEFEMDYIKDLSKIFIRTTAAEKSPNRYDNPSEVYKHTGQPYDLIDFMLKRSFNENIEHNKYYLVLADSGMGKTAFMLNLYLQNYSYINFLFGKRYTIKLLRFQSLNADKPDDILERIKKMNCDDISNTILLLDGLDEDPFIFSKDKSVSDESAFEQRVSQIVTDTCRYKEVVITCRTQYFPQQEDDLYELSIRRDGRGRHKFQKYYIFPFSDTDVHKYLDRKYGYSILKYRHGRKKEIALQIVKNSKNLMVRPMLMSYMDYLLEDEKVYTSSSQIFETLIEKWLERESKKWKKESDRKIFIDALQKFSINVALEIYNKWITDGVLHISKERAIEIASECGYDLSPDEATGKSLLTCDANLNWKFAHKSILEYLLAKEINNQFSSNNFDFAIRFEFFGMDMTKNFCSEIMAPTSLLSMNYVPIKGGEFLMGSPENEIDRIKERETKHLVRLSDFYFCKYVVTVADFKKFIENSKYQTDAEKENCSGIWDGKESREKESLNWRNGPSGKERQPEEYNHPVLYVSWNDADAYCRWLSEKSGKIFRLPTEAEWEYACRAGGATSTPFTTGDKLTTEQANYNGDYPYNNYKKGMFRKNTVPVDSFTPNTWGLYNMHGNVWELCHDRFEGSFYDECRSKGIVTNPDNQAKGSNHVLRGGGWDSGARDCRSAYRSSCDPVGCFNFVGFRLVFVP